jgi:hypothetical protein
MIKHNKQQWSGFIKKENHTNIQKIQNKLNEAKLDSGEDILKMSDIVDMAIESLKKQLKIK